MIYHEQLRKEIIVPALSKLQMYSMDIEELLIFTCAVESNGGTYLKQIKGCALGIYQMEPNTYNDVWQNYIKNRSDITLILTSQFDVSRIPPDTRLVYDLQFATVMARLFYRRFNEELPKCNDIDSIWKYYKKYWNTELGASTKDKSIESYEKFISKKNHT